MKEQKRLYVSEVVQKAFIEINEEGTEAVAATGISCVAEFSAGFISKSYPFIVDHPIVYTIKKKIKFCLWKKLI